jgi:hypothetical protein
MMNKMKPKDKFIKSEKRPSKKRGFLPIASELADDDENFKNKISEAEGLNSPLFRTAETDKSVARKTQIKLDQEQHYDLDGFTRIDGKVVRQ